MQNAIGQSVGRRSPCHRLSAEEREALHKMLAYVSGALPYAIVMKGGGVKGLAFAGALLELENYYWFDRHVGTSAGAIAAVLLAASYTPRELMALLLEKSFRDFMDAPWWKRFRLIFCGRRAAFQEKHAVSGLLIS